VALVELSQVREHALLDDARDANDDLLEQLIDRASAHIIEHAQRQFEPVDGEQTHAFRYEGGGRLSLAPLDARTISSVAVDGVTLAASRYQLLPLPAPHGVHTDLELRNVSPPSRTSAVDYQPSRIVEVTGEWGFEEVPAAVQEACILTVLHLFRHFATAYTAGGIGQEIDVTTDGRRALPFAAVEMLRPFRRSGGV
jgi:hypothetical protein